MQKLCEIIKLLHSILKSLKSIGDRNSMRRVSLFHNNNNNDDNSNNNSNNNNNNNNNMIIKEMIMIIATIQQ